MTVNNTSLLIAGPFHLNTISIVEKYKDIFVSIVILTYRNTDDNNLQAFKENYDQHKNIKILEHTLPQISNYHNTQNIYYQCFSVVNGLAYCNSEYVIKLRSDEVYSGLDNLIATLPKDKVSTNNIFVRDVSYKSFHLSDHIIVGGGKVA